MPKNGPWFAHPPPSLRSKTTISERFYDNQDNYGDQEQSRDFIENTVETRASDVLVGSEYLHCPSEKAMYPRQEENECEFRPKPGRLIITRLISEPGAG